MQALKLILIALKKSFVGKSPLTKKIYKGFSKDKEGFKEWLIKEEV